MTLGGVLSHVALLPFTDRSYLTRLKSWAESTMQSLKEPSDELMFETSKTSLGLVLRGDQHCGPLREIKLPN